MAGKPETRFYAAVNAVLRERYPVYCEKMSNPYRGGTWDFYYEGHNNVLWVEYKFIEAFPKKTRTINLADRSKKPSLSALQQDWGIRAHGNGIKTAVIAGRKIDRRWYGYIRPELTWMEPIIEGDYIRDATWIAWWINNKLEMV